MKEDGKMVVKAKLIDYRGYDATEAMDIFYGMLLVQLDNKMPCQTLIRDSTEDAFEVELDYDGSRWDDQTQEMLDAWETIADFIGEDFGFTVEFSLKK